MKGFCLIDKPVGCTSFSVCGKLRKITNTKKVGHTGTLDPFATGLLVVAVGKCTKLIPFLEKAEKTYRTKIVLGQTSPTLDPESEMEKTPISIPPTLETINKAIQDHFMGTIQQTPPMFSALKVKGQKLCDLARKGQTVEIKSREAMVLDMRVTHYDFPYIDVEMTVGAGFYVRSFARDLAEKLGTKGMCWELRRTKVGDLSVDDAETLEHFSGLIDPKFILTNIPHTDLPSSRVLDFVSGRSFPYHGENGDQFLVLQEGETLGWGEIIHHKLQPKVVL